MQEKARTCLDRRNLGSVSRSSILVMDRWAGTKSVRVGLSRLASITRMSELSRFTCSLARPQMYLR